jgi:hypothetical protein
MSSPARLLCYPGAPGCDPASELSVDTSRLSIEAKLSSLAVTLRLAEQLRGLAFEA